MILISSDSPCPLIHEVGNLELLDHLGEHGKFSVSKAKKLQKSEER